MKTFVNKSTPQPGAICYDPETGVVQGVYVGSPAFGMTVDHSKHSLIKAMIAVGCDGSAAADLAYSHSNITRKHVEAIKGEAIKGVPETKEKPADGHKRKVKIGGGRKIEAT